MVITTLLHTSSFRRQLRSKSFTTLITTFKEGQKLIYKSLTVNILEIKKMAYIFTCSGNEVSIWPQFGNKGNVFGNNFFKRITEKTVMI